MATVDELCLNGVLICETRITGKSKNVWYRVAGAAEQAEAAEAAKAAKAENEAAKAAKAARAEAGKGKIPQSKGAKEYADCDDAEKAKRRAAYAEQCEPIVEGQRNNATFNRARKMAAAGMMDEDAKAEIFAEATAAGLAPKEATSAIRSGEKAGRKSRS